MHGQITDATQALRFMLAGKATLTIRSVKTGTRYTYKIRKAKEKAIGNLFDQAPKPERWFVSMLYGPDNNSDYTYIGLIESNKFRLTRKSRMGSNSQPVAAFRWVLERLALGRVPENVEIWHEGRCGRCGRKLTVPESVSSGFGPECIGFIAA